MKMSSYQSCPQTYTWLIAPSIMNNLLDRFVRFPPPEAGLAESKVLAVGARYPANVDDPDICTPCTATCTYALATHAYRSIRIEARRSPSWTAPMIPSKDLGNRHDPSEALHGAVGPHSTGRTSIRACGLSRTRDELPQHLDMYLREFRVYSRERWDVAFYMGSLPSRICLYPGNRR